MTIVKLIYLLGEQLPIQEQNGLMSHIKRFSVSISSIMMEGLGQECTPLIKKMMEAATNA